MFIKKIYICSCFPIIDVCERRKTKDETKQKLYEKDTCGMKRQGIGRDKEGAGPHGRVARVGEEFSNNKLTIMLHLRTGYR